MTGGCRDECCHGYDGGYDSELGFGHDDDDDDDDGDDDGGGGLTISSGCSNQGPAMRPSMRQPQTATRFGSGDFQTPPRYCAHPIYSLQAF